MAPGNRFYRKSLVEGMTISVNKGVHVGLMVFLWHGR